MKMTKNLTHIASSVEFEPAMTEEQLEAVFAQNGVTGFPAELDIAERTEEHVQMVSLEKFIAFAKASGLSAVTYDVTYFPHADDAEVEYQLKQLARDLEISVEVIRDVCADEIAEYIKLDAERVGDLCREYRPDHTDVADHGQTSLVAGEGRHLHAEGNLRYLRLWQPLVDRLLDHRA